MEKENDVAEEKQLVKPSVDRRLCWPTAPIRTGANSPVYFSTAKRGGKRREKERKFHSAVDHLPSSPHHLRSPPLPSPHSSFLLAAPWPPHNEERSKRVEKEENARRRFNEPCAPAPGRRRRLLLQRLRVRRRQRRWRRGIGGTGGRGRRRKWAKKRGKGSGDGGEGQRGIESEGSARKAEEERAASKNNQLDSTQLNLATLPYFLPYSHHLCSVTSSPPPCRSVHSSSSTTDDKSS